jgi:parallel beta-helix repeat protein
LYLFLRWRDMDTANVTERALPIGHVLGKRALLYVALLVFAFVLVLLLSTNHASATTTINADITANTQLTTADDYVIDGDITVQSGVWLKIDPGVYVNFTDGSSLTVEGYLWANGTSATNQGIRFSSSTGTLPGSWEGIYLNGPPGSRMVFFSISYATNAVVITDTTATVSGTIQFASGNAVTIVRNTGNLNVAASGFVINDAANGLVMLAYGGNIVATITDCVMANVDGNAISATSSENASISVVGGLYTSPSAGMTTAVVASAYWNASVSISGGAAIYFAQSCAAALSDNANAVVSVNGVTMGNVINLGTTFAAGALTFGQSGTAQVTLTNMEVKNATIGAFALAPFGKVNMVVSGVTFDNLTQYGIYAEAFGAITVTLNNVNMTNVNGYGVYVESYEGGATVTMTGVSIIGNFLSIGQGSVYCDVNTTASVTATNFYAANLFLGLSVLTANGNVNLDVSTATIENCFAGISAAAPNGGITARIDPTLINHSVYGVYVTALGNIVLTLVDVDMNDTVFCVFAESGLGNVNFAWTNGLVTGADTTLAGVNLIADEGGVTASMTNVVIQMYTDGPWYWNSGDVENSMLYVWSNHSASVSLTDDWVNYSFMGVFVASPNGNIGFSADGLSINNVIQGVYLEAAGSLTINVVDLVVDNPWTLGPTDYDPIWWTSSAFEGNAVGNVDASFSGVVTNVHGGIILTSDLGDIDFVGTDITRYLGMAYEPGNGWVATDMIWLEAPEGAVTADLSQVDLEMWPYSPYNGYGLYVLSNLTTVVTIDGFNLVNASDGILIQSLIGDVQLDVANASLTDSVNNGILAYAYEGNLTAAFDGVLVNHCWNGNGIVLQALGDLDLTMSNVGVNDSANNGVLVLSSMGNVVLDLSNVEITNSGQNGIDVVAAMGTIDGVIDPSWIFNNDVGMFLDAAGAVTLDVMDTTFENNTKGIEIHSQAGGITVTLDNAEFLNSTEFGLFVEADQDDIMVEGTGSYLSNNWFGFYLRTFLGDVTVNVDNTTFELGEYGIHVWSSNDVFAQLVDDEFLGQSSGGVDIYAMHDATVTYLRDNFDGSMADDAQLFLPSEVDTTYMMIDPDAWTTNTWLTVDLPWDFEFNGEVYDQVTMSVYGMIYFGWTDVNSTRVWDFGPSAPNMIAAAQNPNWITSEYPGIGYKNVEGAIVFHWYVWQADSPQLKNVFQIWLFQNGDAEIRYAMMESKYSPSSPGAYAYGVNFAGSMMNWDLRMWDYWALDNDWMSIHFTMMRMSSGYASYVFANGNITASVTHSSVSHWMTGGMLFECVDGVLTVEISDTSFDFIGGNMYNYWAALALVDFNGTMSAEVTDLSFYYIMGWAIGMLDTPINGGVSSMAITNCVFEQVIACGAMESIVYDSDLTGTYSLSVTKTVENNLGIHAGMFYLETSIETERANWSIIAETVFQDNNITGGLDPWLESMWGLTAPPMFMLGPAQFFSALYYMSAADGESSIQHDVSVMDNILTEAAFNNFGAVGIIDEIIYAGSGSIATDFNLDAQGNMISDMDTYFDYGIFATISQTLTGTDAGSTADLAVNANYENNVLDFGVGNADFGLAMVAYQPVSEGLGTGIMEFDVNVVDNTIWGAAEGVYIWSEASVYNSWGATSSDVAVTIQGNDIAAYTDGIYVNIVSSAMFEHYFPPYETEVSATSEITYMVDISGNDLSVYYDGINVYVSNLAQEDYYGVFTSAMATSSGSIDVYDNYLSRWSSYYYDWLMDIEAWTTSSTGQASSSLDANISVLNNIMYANGGNGVYIGAGAEAKTLERRYDDTASATAAVDVLFQGNQVWYAYDALMVQEWSWATYGETAADVQTTVNILDNVVMEAYSEGLYTDIYAGVDDNWGSPVAYMDAAVVVNNNTVTGDGWDGYCWAIDVEIYDDSDNYWNVFVSGSAIITENTVTNAEGGIYVYGWPVNDVAATITDNTVDSCYWNIEVDYMAFVIQNNLVTNSAYEAISVYGGTGSILDNVVTGMPDMQCYGIDVYGWSEDEEDLYPANYVWIQGNMISGFGGDGIWADNTYGMTITGNEITNIGYSGIEIIGDMDYMEDFISGNLEVTDNVITNVGGGVYVSAYFDVIIEDNVIDGVSMWYGVWVDNCLGFDIMNNVISNAYGGIAITDSADGMVSNNVLSASAVEGDGGGDEEGPESTEIVYGVGIFISYSESIVVSDASVTGFWLGVYVLYSADITFDTVIVTMSSYYGGWFEDSSGVVIQDCVFSMNGDDGLVIDYSDATIIDVVANDNFNDGLEVNGGGMVTVYNGQFNNNGEDGLCISVAVEWIVDGASEVSNNPVYFNGDLTIMDGGDLWLNLLVDFGISGDDNDGLAEITVEAGGMLTAMDVDFYLDEYGEYAYYYLFNVNGGLDFMNVLVTDALELYLGPTSTVQIMTSQIVYNLRNGIVVDGCAPVIMSSTIAMNNRNGLYVINGASPEITDCMIASNARGMYVRDGDMSRITDNVFAMNSEAGILVEQTTGAIRDNVFLFNNKEIMVRGGVVSISDNQIGYSTLIDVMVQFAPLLGLMEMGESAYIPLLGIWVSPEVLSELLFGHIGVYATNGAVVSTSDNEFGMLTTAVMVVDSELTFNDDILSRTLMVPYMGPDGIIRNMSLPVPVYDGIIAKNSEVTVNGGTFKVLDDAIFLDGCTAAISNVTIVAGDFSVFATNSEVSISDSVGIGKLKADGITSITVDFSVVVVVKDPWGNTLADVPVTVRDAHGGIVKQGNTGANGVFVAKVVSFVLTSAGKDSSMNPYKVSADFSDVDTSSYPGHEAEFSPAQPDPTTVSVDGPTSVVVQTNVIVKFFLMTKATDPQGHAVPGATIVLTSANGLYTYSGTTDEDGVFMVLVKSYIQTPNGKDASAEPYSVMATFPTSVEDYGGRVEFTPQVVSDTVTVNEDMAKVVKTGIKVWFDLTVTAKDKFNRTAADVYLVITDAYGVIADDGFTGEAGTATFEVVGWAQSVDGTMDLSMNPYKVTAKFDGNPTSAEASVDMSQGNVDMWIQEIVTEFNWTLTITIALIGALLLGVMLVLIARKD